jgi:hypothetical protein
MQRDGQLIGGLFPVGRETPMMGQLAFILGIIKYAQRYIGISDINDK